MFKHSNPSTNLEIKIKSNTILKLVLIMNVLSLFMRAVSFFPIAIGTLYPRQKSVGCRSHLPVGRQVRARAFHYTITIILVHST